ncbi:hypothetical protein TrVE_jg1092 [Triparma verrucosa]|uniref:WW domain-containing protein n=1 Tax=Triparma verrucosa TaxID=1606542 RepID=A0A9W7CH52_9STRA|nr:hypothetical protein TrVE_jg1092 [Triparma verrucosa]
MGNLQCAADGASLPHNLTQCVADAPVKSNYAGRSGQGFVQKKSRRQRLSAAAKKLVKPRGFDLPALNIDVNVSPEKYVSNNLNAQTALSAAARHVNDENSIMEKVLAENRRLQLLCEKMRSENHTQPTATALDFFSLDESQLDVSKNHHDKLHDQSADQSVDHSVEGGHRLFVDGILGVSSEFMNKGSGNPRSVFEKHTDPRTGKLYYYNKETGKSIWAKEWDSRSRTQISLPR